MAARGKASSAAVPAVAFKNSLLFMTRSLKEIGCWQRERM
jgi:hypothetical protein